LGELGRTDQGHRHGDGREVVDVGSRAVEPGDEVEALAVEGEAVGGGLGGESGELLGDLCEERLDKGGVDVVERLELVEVVLKLALDSEFDSPR
jgi:hypothetical protein